MQDILYHQNLDEDRKLVHELVPHISIIIFTESIPFLHMSETFTFPTAALVIRPLFLHINCFKIIKSCQES